MNSGIVLIMKQLFLKEQYFGIRSVSLGEVKL